MEGERGRKSEAYEQDTLIRNRKENNSNQAKFKQVFGVDYDRRINGFYTNANDEICRYKIK